MLPFHIHFGLEAIVGTVIYIVMWATFLLSAFWKPQFGIYVLTYFLPLQTVRYRVHGMFLGSQFVDLLLLGVVLGLVLQGHSVIPKTPLSKFLLVLAVFYYFSLWEGAYFIDAPLPLWISDPRFSDWKNYVEMFFLALIISSAIRDAKQVRILLLVMAFSVFGLNRNYMSVLSDRNLSHFSYEKRDEGLIGYAGVNGLAAFEAMIFPVLLAGYVYARRFWLKVGLALLAASCIYCLLFSFSRGGYAGALAGLVAIGFLKMRRLLVVAALIFFSWQVLLPTSVQERITMTTEMKDNGEFADHSAEARLIIWEDAIELFMRNPVTGSGFQSYKYMHRVGPYDDTHNYPVKILAETGVVGLLLFLTLVWKLTRLGHKLFSEAAEKPFWAALGLGFVGLMAAAVVANLFGDRWTYQQVDGYLWILAGCVMTGLRVLGETHGRGKSEDAHEGSQNTCEYAVERNAMDRASVQI